MVKRLGVRIIFASICCARIAAAVTVDFDTLMSGTAVADQYLADGVQFIGGFAVANGTFGGALTVPSPPNSSPFRYVQLCCVDVDAAGEFGSEKLSLVPFLESGGG